MLAKRCHQSTAKEMNVLQVEDLFDTVLEDYPTLANRLSETAPIVYKPVFESGICKIMANDFSSATRKEEQEKAYFIAEQKIIESDKTENLTLAKRALKRGKVERQRAARYMDLSFVIPTSNLCERFLSKSGYALSDCQKGILPANFENQLLLHVNFDNWSIDDINALVTGQV